MGKQNKIKVLTYNIYSVKIKYKLKLRGRNMERKTIFEKWKNKELPEEMQKETDSFAEARNGTEEEKRGKTNLAHIG